MGTKDKARSVSPAAKLIAVAQSRARSFTPLSAAALKALKEIIAYNDSVSSSVARVNIDLVVRSLRDDYGWDGGKNALRRICISDLCRKSFGKKS